MTSHDDLFNKLMIAFNAERCRSHVAEIYNSDRWFDFAHFAKTANYCAGQLKASGLAEVELLPLTADGRTRYGDWVPPQAWDARSAVLRFAEGNGEGPVLADYRADPCSLMMYSAPTAAGGVTAEVAVVYDAASAVPDTLKGKLLLTGEAPRSLLTLAKAEGALGVLCDWFPLYPGVRDAAGEMAGHSRWENDFVYPRNDAGLFGFCLSPEAGRRLRDALAQAERQGRRVTLHAEVDTKLYDGVCYTVSGLIPGTGSGETLLCGHLYEPGANDNASGCGALLELAACLQSMIAGGVLPRPRCGFRFAMGFECIGLAGYHAAHAGRAAKTIAGINMDMVGAAACDRSVLNLWHNPQTNWSFADTLLPQLAREYRDFSGDAFDFIETPYSIGDNLLADPSVGVPTVSMVMHPAQSYHSSMDGMDKIDSSVLKRNSVIAGAMACIAAACEPDDFRRLAFDMGQHRGEALARETGLRRAIADAAFDFALEKLSLASGIAAGVGKPAQSLTDAAQPAVRQILSAIPAAGRVPVRLRPGTVTLAGLEGRPRESLKWVPYYDYSLNCSLFWADGQRSLAEIAALSAAELRIMDAIAYAGEITEYFKFLESLGYVRM